MTPPLIRCVLTGFEIRQATVRSIHEFDASLEAVVTVHAFMIQKRGKWYRLLRPFPINKHIHEPRWYTTGRRTAPQVFSLRERKIIPYALPSEYAAYTYDPDRELTRLVSMTLGFIDYGRGETVDPLIGSRFTAFYLNYKTPGFTRYYFTGTRSGEIFPEPFDVALPSPRALAAAWCLAR